MQGLNSNMHITFQINRIISVNFVQRQLQKLRFEKNSFKILITCSKQHKKKFIFYLQSAILSPNIFYVLRNTENLQFVFFHILTSSNLGLSTLYASLTLIVNNFNYDKNLLRPYSTHFNVSIYENKNQFFENSRPRRAFN